MKILSWNILSGGYKGYGSIENKLERFDKLVDAIKKIDVDVVNLVDTHRWTEVFTIQELQQIFNYPFVYTVKLNDERLITKGHDNGVTVLSRIPDTKMASIWISTRNAIKVETREVDIFSVYLDDVSEGTRIKQIKTILGLVNKNKATIITGDLNTIDSSDLIKTNFEMDKLALKYPEPMKTMKTSLNEMKRGEVTGMLADNGFIDLGKGYGNTIPAKLFPLPTEKPIARLDYAFGNEKILLEKFEVLTDEKIGYLSDHYPIKMCVKFK